MKYSKKYKITENNNYSENQKLFFISKEIYKFCKNDVIDIIKKHGYFNIEISYPGIEHNDDSNYSYEFTTDDNDVVNSSDKMSDEEIIEHMVIDDVDIYNMSVSFGVSLKLNKYGMKNIGDRNQLTIINSIIEEEFKRYDIIDLCLDGISNESYWFVLKYRISNHLDILGNLFKKINEE